MEFLEKRNKFTVSALDEVLRYYQWAKEARVETRWERMERTIREISGVVSKITCAANIDDTKDRKKVAKMRKESENRKVDEGHKKRQMKRMDTILNRIRDNKKIEEEARRKARELAEKAEKEAAGRKAALERLQKADKEAVQKLRNIRSMEEVQDILKEQAKVTAEIKRLDSQVKIEREMSIGKGVCAVRGKITKIVKMTIIHTKPVDKEIQEKTCQTAGNIMGLWKKEAITTGGKLGSLLVAPSKERREETDWTVSRVPEGIPNIDVFNKVVEGLKLDGWEKNELVVKAFGEDKGRVVL